MLDPIPEIEQETFEFLVAKAWEKERIALYWALVDERDPKKYDPYVWWRR